MIIGPRFDPAHYYNARLIAARYCPSTLSAKLKRRVRSTQALMAAVEIYVLNTEFNWAYMTIAEGVNINRTTVRDKISLIEDLRSEAVFIDKICDKVRDYVNGLI